MAFQTLMNTEKEKEGVQKNKAKTEKEFIRIILQVCQTHPSPILQFWGICQNEPQSTHNCEGMFSFLDAAWQEMHESICPTWSV